MRFLINMLVEKIVRFLKHIRRLGGWWVFVPILAAEASVLLPCACERREHQRFFHKRLFCCYHVKCDQH